MAATCLEGGLLVGTQHPLPTDPSQHYQVEGQFVGCNRLFCDDCKSFLRHLDGYRLKRDLLSGDEFAQLAAVSDPAALSFLSKTIVPNLRLYFCRCQYHETSGTFAAPDKEDASWRCAGHTKS